MVKKAGRRGAGRKTGRGDNESKIVVKLPEEEKAKRGKKIAVKDTGETEAVAVKKKGRKKVEAKPEVIIDTASTEKKGEEIVETETEAPKVEPKKEEKPEVKKEKSKIVVKITTPEEEEDEDDEPEEVEPGLKPKRGVLGTIWKWIRRIWWMALIIAAAVMTILTITELNRGPAGDGDGGKVPAKTIGGVKTEEVMKPEKIDLQPVVDKWVESVSGNRSVLVYDIDRGEVVAAYNEEESYNTASLYKLFVVYEGYRRVQNGEWDQKTKVPGVAGKTIAECLDLAIRESHSPCAEGMWGMIGHQELNKIIESDFKITGSDIAELKSNPEDILKIMQIFYEHAEITDEGLIAAMKDSFLNQPETTYDWRQGLPSGFSEGVDVYDKVGWAYDGEKKRWNIYHDAAIIEFPNGRKFIVVVMTNYVDYPEIAKLGNMIEEVILQ